MQRSTAQDSITRSDECRSGERLARGALSLVTLATLPDDAEGYGRAIFAALHEADEANLDALLVERVPAAPVWWAVADRVRRAAAVEE